MNSELELVIKIARRAGEILMEYFDRKKAYTVTQKDAREFNFVTEADRDADAFIRAELSRAFPGDRILSEESADLPADYRGRVWMVDPLDDTKGFVNGTDGFAVLIGLCMDGRPVLGVAHAPARPVTFFGSRSGGAFKDLGVGPAPINVSGVRDVKEARFVSQFSPGGSRPSDKFIGGMPVKGHVSEGSVGLKWGLIAEGGAEFYFSIHPLNKWDTCAPQAILEAAGGMVSGPNGAPLDYMKEDAVWHESVVASNGALHDAALALVAEAPLIPPGA